MIYIIFNFQFKNDILIVFYLLKKNCRSTETKLIKKSIKKIANKFMVIQMGCSKIIHLTVLVPRHLKPLSRKLVLCRTICCTVASGSNFHSLPELVFDICSQENADTAGRDAVLLWQLWSARNDLVSVNERNRQACFEWVAAVERNSNCAGTEQSCITSLASTYSMGKVELQMAEMQLI